MQDNIEEKTSFNKQGQPHGHWHAYSGLGQYFVGIMVNGQFKGYVYVYYKLTSEIKRKVYYAR